MTKQDVYGIVIEWENAQYRVKYFDLLRKLIYTELVPMVKPEGKYREIYPNLLYVEDKTK